MTERLNHFDQNGNAVMVDVSEKAPTSRTAVATGEIRVGEAVMEAVLSGTAKKGDVLGVGRIAGIMAAKRTGDMIPLCHPLPLTHCSVEFEADRQSGVIRAVCTVKTDGKTGVEMEALTGVSAALLTVYDMCKAIDKGMVITGIHLMKKSGGRSGEFVFGGDEDAGPA